MNENVINSRHKFINSIFILEMVCVFLAVFSSVWGVLNVTSMVISCNFILIAALVVSTMNNSVDKKNMLLWVGVIVTSYIAVVSSAYSLSFEFLKKWIMFVSTISFMYWVMISDVNETMIKSVLACGVVLGIMFMIAYAMGKDGSDDSMYAGALTFNIENPNTAGVFLLNVFLAIYIARDFTVNKPLKMIYLALCALTVYFMWKTQARSCMIAVVFFFVMMFLSGKKYHPSVTFWVVLFPLIFACLYMLLVKSDFAKHFDFLVSEGKTLTSRVGMWQTAFDSIKEHFVFGEYFNSSIGFTQKHNIHLDTLSSYGIFTFLFYLAFLNKVLNDVGRKVKHKYQMTGIIAFYAVLISSTFEAGLFTGSKGMYALSCGFLMIAKYNRQKEFDRDNMEVIIIEEE